MGRPRKTKPKEDVVKEKDFKEINELKVLFFKLYSNEVIGKTKHVTDRLDKLTKEIKNHPDYEESKR